jgi:ParB family chromosome partitioning protein
MPRAAKETEAMGTLVQLDPELILADDNTRFNLKESRIESLAANILERGGVIEPLEVEPLVEASNGHKYRLTVGFYRLAAVKLLNATQVAGLTVPAILHAAATPVERLKRQMAENLERENQSPMDQAVAIKKLLDAGITKIEVREMFARPGGRKGQKTQPASNSFINMTLSFLDLSKSIQDKIHLGLIGVAAAYQLTKVAPEKRAEVLAAAEEERQKALEREEREEESYLAKEKKLTEAKEKADKLQAELTTTEGRHKQAQADLEIATNKTMELFKASKGKFAKAEDKKAAELAFRNQQAQLKIAEADATSAQKFYEKALKAFTEHDQLVQEKAKKLQETRKSTPAGKGAAKPGKAVSGGDVQKAAKEAGASTSGAVPLTLQEVRSVVNELMLPGGHGTVAAIAKELQSCFMGITTDKQLYAAMVKIVSEIERQKVVQK